MAISSQVLGKPGRDNSVIVRIDRGQSIHRLLFDCGENCLADLTVGETQSIDHLLFSHLHMDHVSGFDRFFRCNYHRDSKPNMIWGPPRTGEILQHRFRGYWWNLHHDQQGSWLVHDVGTESIIRARFELSEAFAVRHAETPDLHPAWLIDTPEYQVKSITLKHHGPCLGYFVQEKSRSNVQVDRLKAMGLQPGPWMQKLKAPSEPSESKQAIEIAGVQHDLAQLRDQLLVETRGDSFAYLTDFLLDEESVDRLTPWLSGCDTLVCECQYRSADDELAVKNAHATTSRVAQLASKAQVGELVLFHLSDRYQREEWLEMLEECRAIFSATTFSKAWNLE